MLLFPLLLLSLPLSFMLLAGIGSPKILARASSYFRCFASRSRCCRCRTCSGVSLLRSAAAAASASASAASSRIVNSSMPVTGSSRRITRGAGFRLNTFICGRNAVADGRIVGALAPLLLLLPASRAPPPGAAPADKKWNSCGFSLRVR